MLLEAPQQNRGSPMRSFMAIALPLLLATSANVQAETLPSAVTSTVSTMMSAVTVSDQRLTRPEVAAPVIMGLSIHDSAATLMAPKQPKQAEILAPETNDADDDATDESHVGSGMASYYGKELAGNRTANGERFNPNELTAAHPSLAFGSKVRVTNLNNGQSVIVRINDRGPFTHRRVIDVSHAAAREIGLHRSGTARVSMALLSQ